jgi:hypothetical protein
MANFAKDKELTPTEPDEVIDDSAEIDDIEMGNYVIFKDAVGVVVGKSTDNHWIVEWPVDEMGNVEFMDHLPNDLVKLNIKIV